MSIPQLRDAVRAATWTPQHSASPPQQQAENNSDAAAGQQTVTAAVLLPHNGHPQQQRHATVILTTCNLDVRAGPHPPLPCYLAGCMPWICIQTGHTSHAAKARHDTTSWVTRSTVLQTSFAACCHPSTVPHEPL